MKKYQAPQIDVIAFDAKDVITAIDFSSFDLGEWADKKGNTNTFGNNWA